MADPDDCSSIQAPRRDLEDIETDAISTPIAADADPNTDPRSHSRIGTTSPTTLEHLPNELLFHILTFLDIPDLLTTARLNHHLRALSTTPILHSHRLRTTRLLLPSNLTSRPSLTDLIQRHIFLTPTTVVSKRLARSLVSIRLGRKLSRRPKPQDLVARAVLPQECVPPPSEEGLRCKWEAPGIVQRKKVIERERIKDGLRRWLEGWWLGEKGRRESEVRRWEEEWGVGRVWRLRRFWEGIGRGDEIGVS